MSVYLHDIPLHEAQAHFQQALESAGMWQVLHTETIPLGENACGRVLAAPIWAELSSPHYHAAAMDGYAVRAEETSGAMPNHPLILALPHQAEYVDTGDPMPEWANAVIPIEDIEPLKLDGSLADDPRAPDSIRIRAALPPWQYVRPLGEDIIATQLVLAAGHVLRPVDLGAIAACGHTSLLVSRPPQVAILPTGTELVPVGTKVKRGDIIEYNSIVLAGQVKTWGGLPDRYSITPDDFKQLKTRIQEAADSHDLVLVNAGSSAGAEDFTAPLVEDLGELLVHGVAVRPGHPVILGMIRRTTPTEGGQTVTPIIGVPGYPVSAALTGEIFIEPLLARWMGRVPFEPIEVQATLTRKVTSRSKDDDYMRVVAGRVGEKLLAAPLSRGSGVITSLVRADGITILPRGVQGLEAGSPVNVRLYRNPKELEQTIFAIGSHDMTLDLLAYRLVVYGRRLVSANVGSLGGLIALRRGETHIAGTHLLDPETGEYNLSYLRTYLPDTPVRLVTWAYRKQGLMVAKGNPLEVTGLTDLTRDRVRYINRQRGAGTRVLFDFHLDKLNISPEAIHGYQQEEFTHLAVAAAIASGRADTGMGVAAAAQALDLDFVPLFDERYDLAIPLEYANDDLLAPVFDLMQDVGFRETVAAQPGYDVSDMGKIQFEG
ncbi:MAG: molybdopterin biosynthesis protein [Anaerolineaceae bacterium]|jgi:putative molybdopterin biosynthesis protein|nr:molybdopterin biosynthesis protein [Anaerolineaceae bacterium]